VVIREGIEAWIIEVSVTGLIETCKAKSKQLERYVTDMSVANRVERNVEPLDLWLRFGLSLVVVSIRPTKAGVGVVITSPARQRTEQAYTRQKGVRGMRALWRNHVEPFLKGSAKQLKTEETLKVVVYAPSKLTERTRKACVRGPDRDVAVVRGTGKKLNEVRTTLLGRRARHRAHRVGLTWTRDGSSTPSYISNSDLVAIHPVRALFDVVGTAYPGTGDDYAKACGRRLTGWVGAGVVLGVPQMIQHWKDTSAMNVRMGKVVKIS
jgi:hypothetical protein